MDDGFVKKLKVDYPELKFRSGKRFAFRHPRTIVLGPQDESGWKLQALHEVAHALLKHRDYRLDVERLKMEVAAWEKARELAAVYGVIMDEELVQEELDTYRDWLHQKSRCSKCGLTRFQTPDGRYHCPRCEQFETKK